MILTCKDITISYEEQVLFAPLSFSLNKGDKLIIKGASGKGKSTLLSALLGFYPMKTGEISHNEKLLNSQSALRAHVAWLPQDVPASQQITVKEFILQAFSYDINKHIKPTDEEIENRCNQFLLRKDILTSKMSEVSGGERQRIGLITVLFLRRELLFLDEPVSALDADSKAVVMDFLFSQEDLTIVSTSHDTTWASRCNQSITLK